MSSIRNALLRKNLVLLTGLLLVCSSVYSASPNPTLPPAQDSEYSGEPISLKVVGISVTDFFRTISELSGLNILIDPDVSGSLTLNVEQVPWDQIFDAVLQSQGLAKRIEGNLIRITTQGRLRSEQELQQQLKEAELLAADTVLISHRLNYAEGGEMLTSLEPHLTPRGSINVDDRTNTLIITDIPDGLEQVTSLIELLDVAEKQVEIEARIVEASTNFARALGVQLGIGIGGNNFDFFTGGEPEFTTEVGPGARRNGGFAGTQPFGGAPNPGIIGGFSTGKLIDVFRLDAIITAGERDGEAQILSKPRVTAQNNAEATITQGSQIPVPVQQNFTTTVEFQTAALQLTVTPRVTSVDTILMDITVQNNVPDFGTTVLGIPAIRTSEAHTQVLVADGGTTVIGGIYIEQESESEDRVPGLGSIPLLGNLFKTTAKSQDTREILFFITARVQKNIGGLTEVSDVQETSTTADTGSATIQD
ncbi:MAG: type IV pilus secretin PilQ [Acidobacteriota bacterium]